VCRYKMSDQPNVRICFSGFAHQLLRFSFIFLILVIRRVRQAKLAGIIFQLSAHQTSQTVI